LSTWPTGGFDDRGRSRGKAEVFDGRQAPHPAAADLFHSLLTQRMLPLFSGRP
jgi:hypothetical protein